VNSIKYDIAGVFGATIAQPPSYIKISPRRVPATSFDILLFSRKNFRLA